jgi:hypothetical protein
VNFVSFHGFAGTAGFSGNFRVGAAGDFEGACFRCDYCIANCFCDIGSDCSVVRLGYSDSGRKADLSPCHFQEQPALRKQPEELF